MFRIRRIYDNALAINREAISKVQQILRDQFDNLSDEDIEKLPDQLLNPLKHRFRSILFIADDGRGHVKGFALLMHAADLNFCYLDFISAAKFKTSRGIGSALYDKIRAEALELDSVGLFFECLPDDPALCQNESTLVQNAARLRFYERYGARPISNTKYETPVGDDIDSPPFLVFDGLGQDKPLRRSTARAIIAAILDRKYQEICPQSYIDMVVESITDDPVVLRAPKYIKKGITPQIRHIDSVEMNIALVVNEQHDIHHVNDRGYVESPVRIKSILNKILPTGLFEKTIVKSFSEKHIRAVHDSGFVNYLKKVCKNVPGNKSIYPYVFPIRNTTRPPVELPVRAGYYCIDTFTPLNHNAYLAAKRAVDCALTAADKILNGHRIAYALVRPPGHHAERKSFGGFCYFNSAAIAAQYLCSHGKVAMLDIDYHHGNGQQNIFYERSDVLTISIHGHPRFAYPYFSGFADESGKGQGKGYNLNFPMPEELMGEQYRQVLEKALKKIQKFNPQFLIVLLGLDTAKGDPTGTWNLSARDFEINGRLIGTLTLPVLVVQEGGYKMRSLGVNARNFFNGLWDEVNRNKYTVAKKERNSHGH